MVKEPGPSARKPVLRFKVDFDRQPEETINVIAYMFDHTGRLLATAPVEKNVVLFPFDPRRVRGARIFFVPQPPEKELKTLTLADMEALHAYEPIWRFDPELREYELLPIPYEIWKWWLFCLCRVRGRVVKPIVINGITVEKPVCDARVHICEVDRLYWLIPRLPDEIIWRLRDHLLRELLKPVTLPVLPDPPLPDPPELLKPQVRLESQPLEPRLKALSQFNIGRSVRGNPEPIPIPGPTTAVQQPLAATIFEQLTPEVRAGLTSSSINAVKRTLIDQLSLVLPYICLWPWFHPYLCICDPLTEVLTDHAGRFDTTIWYRCFGDKPDLYFWVECLIEGTWTTVYRPTICCHTYWDYSCGQEVTLRITDPRVPFCEPVPDLSELQIVITTIGNEVSMSEIVDTAGATCGLVSGTRPFAGRLELRLDASRSNLIAAGVTHYRWSFCRLTTGDNVVLSPPGTWQAMTGEVSRFYKVLVPDPSVPGGFKPEYRTEKMGPFTVNSIPDLFKIQPAAPLASGAEWSAINEHIDLAWAYFETAGLYEPGTAGSTNVPAAGQYEVKLELFKSDGTLVNWSNPTGAATPTPINVLMADTPAPFPVTGMTTKLAAPEHLITDSSKNIFGYKMVLHVDNHPCEAKIFETWVDSSLNLAGSCGFIRFANKATSDAYISFRARHPYNYAQFKFNLVKGSSGTVVPASVDPVPGSSPPALEYAPVSSPVNGFARTASSIFSKHVPVATLLDANKTVCAEAAFGESLHVASIATNGYSYADWLDAWAIPMAFALAPVASP